METMTRRDKKVGKKCAKRSEEAKTLDHDRKLYKGLREKLKRARNDRDEYKTDLDNFKE